MFQERDKNHNKNKRQIDEFKLCESVSYVMELLSILFETMYVRFENFQIIASNEIFISNIKLLA